MAGIWPQVALVAKTKHHSPQIAKTMGQSAVSRGPIATSRPQPCDLCDFLQQACRAKPGNTALGSCWPSKPSHGPAHSSALMPPQANTIAWCAACRHILKIHTSYLGNACNVGDLGPPWHWCLPGPWQVGTHGLRDYTTPWRLHMQPRVLF